MSLTFRKNFVFTLIYLPSISEVLQSNNPGFEKFYTGLIFNISLYIGEYPLFF